MTLNHHVLGLALLLVPIAASAAPVHPFRITTTDGVVVTDKTLRGKVVALDFWATWCGPCRAVSKEMQKLQDKYGSRGFQVICVDVQEETPSVAAAVHYKTVHHYTYPFSVKNNALDTVLNVATVPTVLILDKAGNVAFRETGFYPASPSKYESTVRKALGAAR